MAPLFWVAAICAVGYLPLTARPAGLLRSIVKTAAVAGLALAAGLAQAPMMLVVALVFCALGDWLLSRDGDRAFMAGVATFAAGHFAYIILFLLQPLADVTRVFQSPQIWIAVTFVAVGVIMAMLLAPRAGALRLPVLGYIPIILGMGIAALALPGQGWVLLAATLFIGSDLVLASEKFLIADGHPALRWTPYIVWPLYWGAQAGFFVTF
jgi:uncharacterized membrane protein YhhN